VNKTKYRFRLRLAWPSTHDMLVCPSMLLITSCFRVVAEHAMLYSTITRSNSTAAIA